MIKVYFEKYNTSIECEDVIFDVNVGRRIKDFGDFIHRESFEDVNISVSLMKTMETDDIGNRRLQYFIMNKFKLNCIPNSNVFKAKLVGISEDDNKIIEDIFNKQFTSFPQIKKESVTEVVIDVMNVKTILYNAIISEISDTGVNLKIDSYNQILNGH